MTGDSARHRAAVLDGVTLESLASSLGGGEHGWGFVRELIDTLLDDGPAQLEVLRAALERGDASETRRAAHTLKSHGATFGAGSFSDLCREIETLSREGALGRALEVLPGAEDEWLCVRAELAAARQWSDPT